MASSRAFARRIKGALVALGAFTILATSSPGALSAEVEDELIKTPTETSVLNTGVMFKSTKGAFME
jgi:hypothetical protein